MRIHEYQAKELLRKFGVAVLRGRLAHTPEEAEEAAAALATPICAVKAQIHAGGRGKAGGVKLARDPEEAHDHAEAMLGTMLRTAQTGPEGQKVRKVYVEEGCRIQRELYLGMTLDRETGRVTVMASTEGGVDIEEVAAKHPEKILRVAIDPLTGLQANQGRSLAFALGLRGDPASRFVQLATALYHAYAALDASLAEVNPLVVTADGGLVALDAKLEFDDNALARHPEVAALRDPDEEQARELEAKEHDLSYVALSGDIACMVNGAGLAMGTMDIIQLAGGRPANFLDVGRRRERGAGHGGVQDPALRPGGAGGARQHLRRDHEVRRHREGHRRGGAAGGPVDPARGAARGHQRRAGQADPRAERARDHPRRRPRGRGAQGGRGGARGRRPGGVTRHPTLTVQEES